MVYHIVTSSLNTEGKRRSIAHPQLAWRAPTMSHEAATSTSLWYDHFWIHLVYHLPLISLLTSSPLFTLFTLPMTLFTLRSLVIFYHSNGIIFTSIVWYDYHYVKNHPPKDFQVHISLFDWVLGVVTFLLPLEFNPIFSYLKPDVFTWNKWGSLFLCLKNLSFKFQLNLMRQSKVIGPPS